MPADQPAGVPADSSSGVPADPPAGVPADGAGDQHPHAPLLDAPPDATVETLLRARFAELLGGWRGALETAVPTVVFVVLWSLTKDVRTAVLASLVAVAVLAGVRLAQRQTVRFALSSVAATVIAGFVALRTGQAEAAFLPGMLYNAGFAVACAVSVLARWPLLGFMVAAADPKAATDLSVYTTWRAHDGMVALCSRLTLVLLVLFSVRVAVMLPLYLAAQVEWLGVAKIVLSWPAYLLAISVMAGMLMRGRTPLH